MQECEAIRRCEEMIQKHSTTFYFAFKWLPSPKREAVYTIYAFCRLIDDAVDEPETSPYTLGELKRKFAALNGTFEYDDHFIWPALNWLFANFNVPKSSFIKLMRGQEFDLSVPKLGSIDELSHYCYLVAGTVGEMLTPILHDNPNRSLIQAGVSLGKSMQIVNIIRDIGEDQARGRRYLPLMLMEECGYTEEMFTEKIVNDAFIDCINMMILQCNDWMNRGLAYIREYPEQSAFCMELSALGYYKIIDQIKANHFQVYTKRAVVDRETKYHIFETLSRKYGMDKAIQGFV